MKRKLSLLLLVLPLLACNLPAMMATEAPTDPLAALNTAAALTVAAGLTQAAVSGPAATSTPSVTNTPAYTATNTPVPCLRVGFDAATIDVTIPDNTVMMPGQSFIKTWRLTNTGSCTWNSSYQMIFDHGDGMGVASGYAQALTAGTVGPGQTVDVSVTLTAPAVKAVYTGYWLFRDPGGIVFGIGGSGTWLVKIKVADPDVASLTPVVGPSGTLRQGGGPWPDYTVGESNSDMTKTVEAFLTYDLTGIPAGATITDVTVNFSAYATTGNPFALGVLHGYVTDYGDTLEPADFVVALPAAASELNWASGAALSAVSSSNEMKAALQARVGTPRLQLRLQFAASDLNGVKDRITFSNPILVVSYYTVP